MHWVERCLVHAFGTCFLCKQMVLVFNNAPYHHGMVDCWKSPLRATKSENVHTRRSLGVRLTSAERNDKHVERDTPTSGAVPKPPRELDIDEVRQALLRALRTFVPDRLLTRAESYFENNKLGFLLHTRPYCPDI